MKTKLNLGAGYRPMNGYVNLDADNLPGVDLVHNLINLPLPFGDNSFDEIIGDHILEHLPNLNELMQELYRITKPDGLLKFKSPHFASGNMIGDPTHITRISTLVVAVFDCSDPFHEHHPWRRNNKFKFNLVYRKITFPKYLRIIEWFVNKFPRFYEYHLCYILQPDDIIFHLKVIK